MRFLPSLKRPRPVWLFFSMLLVGAGGGCGRNSPEPGGLNAESGPRAALPAEQQPLPAPETMKPGEPIENFILTDQRGAAFESASLLGKVWIGSIFFANCPGPCFRENQAIADILREIDSDDFLAVSITCDPENDTPEALRRYADRFQADPTRWKFLTGDMDVIKRVGMQDFLLPVEVGVHSERAAVFDRKGRLRGSYHLLQADRVDRLMALVREVLAEDNSR